MDAYQMIEYKPVFPVDDISKALYEYEKRKKEIYGRDCRMDYFKRKS